MKNGFTLIELLAVIVILAIIAVIATPIVLNIINDTKESALLRSAQFYLNGAETSVATSVLKGITISDGIYSIMSDGNLCIGTLSNNTCSGDILKVEMDGEVPTSGTVTIISGQISDILLNLSDKVIVKNNKGELVIEGSQVASICKLIDDADNSKTITVGDKYQCKVKDNMEESFEEGYYFYVLSAEQDGTTNLIMDRNINSDGTIATKAIEESEKQANGNIYNLINWNNNTSGSSNGNGIYGPVTAMQFLYNATKDWVNIPALNYVYNEREYNGILESNTNRGYKSFTSNNGVATITPLSGSSTIIGTTDIPLRARMPIFAAIYDNNGNKIVKGEVFNKKEDNSNIYLYNYLELYNNIQTSSISGIYGYWTLSSYSGSDGPYPFFVAYDGRVTYRLNDPDISGYGVRPVINIKL